MLFLRSGTPELVRNQDIQPELARMAAGWNFDWIVAATRGWENGDAECGEICCVRLALDTFATALER